MSDLRTLPWSLSEDDVVSTPPYEAVVMRSDRIRARRSALQALATATVLLAAAISVRVWTFDQPGRTARITEEQAETATPAPAPPPAALPSLPRQDGPTDTPQHGAPTPSVSGTPAPRGPSSGAPVGPHLECRARANGGNTGPGVTATKIKLIAGAQQDGPRGTVAAEAVTAWKSVFDDVNRGGGICGRLVDLAVIDGLFARPLDLGAANYLGLLAGPFDPDFDARLADGTIDRWGLPVVGSDGTARAHFGAHWNWPVGLSTPGFTRIAVEEAYKAAGARTFALVYDSKHPWGTEAEAAFSQYVATLPGAEVRVVQPLDPGQSSYASEADRFNSRCGGDKCDAVVLAVLPDTLKAWMARNPAMGALRSSAIRLVVGGGGDRTAQDCVHAGGDQVRPPVRVDRVHAADPPLPGRPGGACLRGPHSLLDEHRDHIGVRGGQGDGGGTSPSRAQPDPRQPATGAR